ncbi:acetolactate decarboxylase [Mycobacterium parmense]|uniref:Alpha-acetolactate decarboxylase n=1 Tax=Mycobacterium parmense TaxID=185642 RepID=A0A7I7YQ89_9MYCO|nr:acetolactate decarboxylase [Mycobacterium parmense]MCV7353675.1 acetolactate decarboxylase [Mycobacterium parmense]ORW61193.1 alpha-acetolactate decarboxylase [Mycobacterium parmense]BBZ43457.1 alpha-acetolactate decarboxylase [Mycobacterium parmense]
MTTAYDRFRHWATRLLDHQKPSDDHDNEVYQFSTISALLEGVYDGDVTVADILRHGDFGLGTFNHLDGEMVVLDGVCYRLRADGTASRAAPTDRTPFAAVTRFHSDFEMTVERPTGRTELLAAIDRRIESANLIYAIRITGRFAELRTRTVMAQRPPYPPLTQATEEQAEMVFTGVSGTVVGFRTPEFEQGISVAGYHLHFLDDDRTRGGHILDFVLERGQIAVSGASQMHLSLPTSGAFLGAQLSGADLAERIDKAEGPRSKNPD